MYSYTIRKRGEKILGKHTIFTIITVFFLVVFLGLFVDAWIFLPTPRGWDTIHHLYLVKYILNYWPNCNWNYQWAGGMPQFRWYPSLPYYLMAIFVKLFGLSIEFTLIFFVMLSLFLMGLGFYGFTYEVTEKRGISLVAAFSLLTSPCLWSLHVNAGLQPRLMALAFLPLSWLFLVRCTKDRNNHKGFRLNFMATILSVSLSLFFHIIYGSATLLSTLFFCFIFVNGWGRKISAVMKIGLISILLNPFPLLAQIYSPIPNFNPSLYDGPTLALLFSLPSPNSLLSISPLSTLLTISLLVIVIRFKMLNKRGIEFKALTASSLLGLLTSIFIAVGAINRGGPYYLWSPIGPGEAMVFLPFCLTTVFSVLLSKLCYKISENRKNFLTFLLCLLMIISFILQASLFIQPSTAFNDFLKQQPNGGFKEVYRQLKIPEDETSYRVGIYASDGYMGQWFNYQSEIPQTRDYFSQGILYPDWIAWFYDGVWNQSENYMEKNFLLEWFAVKWIIVDRTTSNPSIFLQKPQFYRSIANVTIEQIYEFEFKGATRIISANLTPSMLVIGKHLDIMHCLSYSDFNSRFIIPVDGGKYIDDYTLEELKQFDSILIYDYRYHNFEKAWKLLQEFVNSGGGLIIETGVQYTSEWNSSSLPSIFPIDRTRWINKNGEWSFSHMKESVTEGVSFSSFSPAVEYGNPWGYSASFNGSVRPWAEPVLWNHGNPVIVIGGYGKGRVVWSGLNLPWHIQIYKNYEESRFLSGIIDWVSRGLEKKSILTDYNVRRINPEKIVVALNNASNGVLLKEFYFKDWHAYLEVDGERTSELKIFRAGPSFMYVCTPKEVTCPFSIVFEYSNLIEYVAIIISLTTMLLLVVFVVLGEKLDVSYLIRMYKKLYRWWLKEE